MKELRFLGVFAIVIIVVATLDACASADSTMRMDDSAALALGQDIPVSETLSGNYLAGRFAQRQQDWNAAQTYMNTVSGLDKDNMLMEQRAFLLSLAAAQYPKSKELALKLAGKENAELAMIYLACDALAHDEFKAAEEFAAKLPSDGFGQYTKPLLTAWAWVGQGKKDAALKLLQEGADPLDPTYNIHAALIEELTGDMNAAAKHYKTTIENGLTLQTAVISANFFQRYGQPEISKAVYDGLGKLYPFNPFDTALSANEAQPNITRPADGAGVALLDLATLLYERRAYDSAQIYSSLVQLLTPKAPFAMLMTGDIAALSSQFQRSVDDYNTIPKESPIHWLSQMRVAEVYEVSGHMDKSVALLTNLAVSKETHLQALVALGDLYRRHEKFDKALAAYDEALSDIDRLTVDHWPIIYARGMALERLNNWDRAEKDLLTALAFQPDNPQILNFIGYSWVDKGMNMDKALDYIRRAVTMRPDDGYIVDSYGWALYRTGSYDQSVEWLEKAAAMVPDDSTILDHLGDVYWQVGRQNEARFKWKRAHDLSNDSAFRQVVEHKIRQGIAPAPAPALVAHKEAKL